MKLMVLGRLIFRYLILKCELQMVKRRKGRLRLRADAHHCESSVYARQAS